MVDRLGSYDDRYGAAVDASRTGQVTVTVDSVTVTEPRRAGWEASDEQRALYIALETARSEKPETRITEAESERACAEWKTAAYQKHAEEAPKDERIAAKLTYWQGVRDRLRQRDATRNPR